MKKLELNQMDNLNGGTASADCQDEALGFLTGAVVGGTLAGGVVGMMVGGTVGLIGSTFIAIAKVC